MNPALPMTSGLTRGDDFADWVNPLLVKTLRQHLRSNVFVGVFLWTQVSLALLVGFQALVDDQDFRMRLHYLRWADIFLVLTVMVPLWPVFVADEDRRPETLDLIRLTRISTQKMADSKMLCALTQAVLLSISMLPYELLSYFLGMELLVDLEAFVWLIANMIVLAPWGILVGSLPLAGRLALAPLLIIALLFVFGGLMAILVAKARGMWCPWLAMAPVAWLVGFGLAAARYEAR